MTPLQDPPPHPLAYGLPVKIITTPSERRVEVRGSDADITRWLVMWGQRYGSGYDPSVDSDKTINGVRTVKVSRLASCD